MKYFVLKLIIICPFIISSNLAWSFSKFVCAGSNVYTTHSTTNKKMSILKATFTNWEVEEIKKSIAAWGRDKIAKTSMDLQYEDLPSVIETEANTYQGYSNVYQRDNALRTLMRTSSRHTIYRRGAAAGSGPNDWFNWENGLGNGVYGWLGIRIESDGVHGDGIVTSGCISGSYQIVGAPKWDNDMDIIINRPVQNNYQGGTSLPAEQYFTQWWRAHPYQGRHDIQNVASHEIGHWMGLLHPNAWPQSQSYNYQPSIMLDSPIHTSNFSGSNEDPSYQRYTEPLGDDQLGVQSEYPSNSPLRTDGATNQWQYATSSGGGFFVRNQSAYYNSALTLEVGSLSLYWGYVNPLAVPITIHNLGTSSRWISGQSQFRQSPFTSVGGPVSTWGMTVPKQSVRTILRYITPPHSSTYPTAVPGRYSIHSKVLNDPAWSDANNLDQSAKFWYFD